MSHTKLALIGFCAVVLTTYALWAAGQAGSIEPVPGIAEPAMRPPAGAPPTPDAVQKGNAIYSASCAACHGLTGRGGPGGAPDLTASAIAMASDGGAKLLDFLAVGRPERGMPPHPVTNLEAASLSAKLRALGFAAALRQNESAPASVSVGDASAGKAFFNGPVGQCSACHAVEAGVDSAAENLSNIATKYTTPRNLQNAMILPDRRFYWSPANSEDVVATLLYKDGHSWKGYLSSVSDFKVIVRDEDGKERVIERHDGEPKVTLADRLQHHLDLLPLYHDTDIHDLTAYLVTLK